MRMIPPRAVWTRHFPTAHAIAEELARWPALAALRYTRLRDDVCSRYDVSRTTAAVAIRLFREAVSS